MAVYSNLTAVQEILCIKTSSVSAQLILKTNNWGVDTSVENK